MERVFNVWVTFDDKDDSEVEPQLVGTFTEPNVEKAKKKIKEIANSRYPDLEYNIEVVSAELNVFNWDGEPIKLG